VPISQVLYLDPMPRGRTLPRSSCPVRRLLKPLISGGFEHRAKRPTQAFRGAAKMQMGARRKKISLANFWFGITLSERAECVRFQKGEPNGLESTKNRRSAGRHGNQHVCVRRPQISGSDSFSF
jgi:hypothetical protein